MSDGTLLIKLNLFADWLLQIELMIFRYGDLILNVMSKKCSNAGKSLRSMKPIFRFSLDSNDSIMYTCSKMVYTNYFVM